MAPLLVPEMLQELPDGGVMVVLNLTHSLAVLRFGALPPRGHGTIRGKARGAQPQQKRTPPVLRAPRCQSTPAEPRQAASSGGPGSWLIDWIIGEDEGQAERGRAAGGGTDSPKASAATAPHWKSWRGVSLHHSAAPVDGRATDASADRSGEDGVNSDGDGGEDPEGGGPQLRDHARRGTAPRGGDVQLLRRDVFDVEAFLLRAVPQPFVDYRPVGSSSFS